MAITRQRIENLWLAAMFTTLLGYAVFDRAFGNFFIGEFLIVVGVGIFLASRRIFLLFKDPVLLIWTLFAIFGAYRTVPYLKTYRFDAVRDAVLYGYGLCAVLFAAFINSSEQITHLLDRYRRFARWYIVIFPVLAVLSGVVGTSTPTIPWSSGGVHLLDIKSGDAGVMLSGVAGFLLLFRSRKDDRLVSMTVPDLLAFTMWMGGLVFVLVRSRSGFLAIVVPLVLISILRAKTVGIKVAVYMLMLLTAGTLLLESNLVTIGSGSRSFNADVITRNLNSIVGSAGAGSEQEATKKFRTIWWGHIVDYTFKGPYFWTGRGFGINLALLEGHGATDPEEAKLRSPHSGTMSVLARMGVPGLVLWILLTFTFTYRMYRSYRNAARRGSVFWSSVSLWIFSFWLAAFVNMSFDVYIEGPQGGIWFWSLMGMGIAVARVQEHEMRRTRPTGARVLTLDVPKRERVFANV